MQQRTCCCITNKPQTSQPETVTLVRYLSVSGDHGSGVAPSRCLVRCSPGVSGGSGHLEAGLGLDGPLPGWLDHAALGWKPQFLAPWTVHGAAPVSSRQGSWSPGPRVMDDLVLEITDLPSHHFLFVRSTSLGPGHAQEEGINPFPEGRIVKEFGDVA